MGSHAILWVLGGILKFRFWPFITIWLYHVISHTNLQLDRKTAGRKCFVYPQNCHLCRENYDWPMETGTPYFQSSPYLLYLQFVIIYARRGREPISVVQFVWKQTTGVAQHESKPQRQWFGVDVGARAKSLALFSLRIYALSVGGLLRNAQGDAAICRTITMVFHRWGVFC